MGYHRGVACPVEGRSPIGANELVLSAVVSIIATREGGARPAAQLLIYPATDFTRRHPSYRLFSDGFFLTEAEMDWYQRRYLPSEEAVLGA